MRGSGCCNAWRWTEVQRNQGCWWHYVSWWEFVRHLPIEMRTEPKEAWWGYANRMETLEDYGSLGRQWMSFFGNCRFEWSCCRRQGGSYYKEIKIRTVCHVINLSPQFVGGAYRVSVVIVSLTLGPSQLPFFIASPVSVFVIFSLGSWFREHLLPVSFRGNSYDELNSHPKCIYIFFLGLSWNDCVGRRFANYHIW